MTPSSHPAASGSGGPRTPEGKSRSSQNARTHGLTAKILKIGEHDQPAFAELSSALRGELQPLGELESTLFDRILHAQWNLQKLATLEGTLLAELDPFNADHTTALSRLSLYRSRTESSLYKAQAELRRLQEERHLREIALDEPQAYSPIVAVARVQKSWLAINQRIGRNKRTGPFPGSTAPTARNEPRP
jgi:hypothetical protein